MSALVVIAISAAALGLVGAGLLLGRVLRRPTFSARTAPGDDIVLPDFIEAEIAASATAWAREHGRPELAGLLRQKVRVAFWLDEQRRGGRSSEGDFR